MSNLDEFLNIFLLEVKVSKFRNVFLVSSISSKKEQKQVELRYHSSKDEFIRLYVFGKNISLKKSFRLCLTFSSNRTFKFYRDFRFVEIWF